MCTLLHEQHVQEFVHDQIVEYLRYRENPKVTMVLVDQRLQLSFVRQVDDHNQLLIDHFS
jgi:GTP-binding protein EngB required for normal cell division